MKLNCFSRYILLSGWLCPSFARNFASAKLRLVSFSLPCQKQGEEKESLVKYQKTTVSDTQKFMKFLTLDRRQDLQVIFKHSQPRSVQLKVLPRLNVLFLLLIFLPVAEASLGISPDSLTFDVSKNLPTIQRSFTIMNPSNEPLFFKIDSENNAFSFSSKQGVIQPKDKTKITVNYVSNKSASDESFIYVLEQNNDDNSNIMIGAAIKAIIKGNEKKVTSKNTVYIPKLDNKKEKFQLNPIGLLITCSVVLIGLGVYMGKDLKK